MKSDGSVIIDTQLRTDGMEKGFKEIKSGAQSVVNDVQGATEKINAAFSKVDVSKSVSNAALKVESLKQQLSSVTSEFNLAVADNDDKAAERLAAKRVSLYDRLEAARKKLEIEVAAAANREATAEEKAAKRAAAAAEKEAARKEKAAKKQFDSATKAATKFNTRLGGIASGALVFNVISAGLREVTAYFGDALKANDEYTQSWSRLKGALLTAFQPIYEYALPAIISLMDIASKVAQAVGHIFSSLGGKSDAQMVKNAQALYEQSKALDKVGDSAKKAAKGMASFDEITKVSKTGTVGTSSTAPDFSDFDSAEYKAKIDDLTTYVSLSLLALGAILTFSGANIPLGIGLLALGAVGLATEISTNWDGVKEALSGSAGKITAIVSGAFLALGAILAFSGVNIPLGIGLLAVGAVGLATTVAANWSTIKEALQGPIGEITAAVSGALLVLGAVLAFSGAAIPLGIGLMAAGAAGMATVVAVNWNAIIDALKGPVGQITAIVSGALLVIGAILAFTGVGIPLGIGLMAAGAAGLAAVVAVNWDSLKKPLNTALASILAIISGAGLVMGVLLCLTGAGLPLGLALIAAGLAGSVKAWNLDDNPVTRFVKNMANGIINIINIVIDAINEMFHLKFDGLVIAGVEIIPSFDTKLLSVPKIPMLAQGAVIPPNAPFAAVLGDQRNGRNLEAPEGLIRTIFQEEMAEFLGGMMGGFEAVVERLDRINGTVSNIEVGDTTIGQAANRYNRELNTSRGGA